MGKVQAADAGQLWDLVQLMNHLDGEVSDSVSILWYFMFSFCWHSGRCQSWAANETPQGAQQHQAIPCVGHEVQSNCTKPLDSLINPRISQWISKVTIMGGLCPANRARAWRRIGDLAATFRYQSCKFRKGSSHFSSFIQSFLVDSWTWYYHPIVDITWYFHPSFHSPIFAIFSRFLPGRSNQRWGRCQPWYASSARRCPGDVRCWLGYGVVGSSKKMGTKMGID